jgi:itaconate CoA-transferase
MLIQAESGLASVTGTSEPSRVGVSVVDIAAGMNAYEAILEALIARQRAGKERRCQSRCLMPWPIG